MRQRWVRAETSDDGSAPVLQLLYGEGGDGQRRAFAALADEQEPMSASVRHLLSHDTRKAVKIYGKLRRRGDAISVPLLDEASPLSLRPAIMARWGKDLLRPEVVLAQLRSEARLSMIGDELARWLARDADVDQVQWEHLNTFGLSAEAYLTDLIVLRRILARQGDTAELLRLDTELSRLVDTAALANLDAVSANRGLLICGTHAGAFRFGYHFLKERFPALVAVAGGEVNGKRSDADRVGLLFSLAKSLRKPGTVALIGADGRNGESSAPMRVRDLDVPIRLGAPTLLFNARCAGVFFLNKWIGDRLVIECIEAPAVQPGTTFGDWSARWLDAYSTIITRLLAGDPANVHGTWGIWRTISEALGFHEPGEDAE